VTDKSDYSSWGIITSTIRLEEKGPVHTRPEAKWWCGVTTTLFRVTDEHRAVSEPVTISPASEFNITIYFLKKDYKAILKFNGFS